MKNKKLFAILTLVCFMFTLMPVAAFAAEPVDPIQQTALTVPSYLEVEKTDRTVAAKEAVTVEFSTTTSYLVYAVDADGNLYTRLQDGAGTPVANGVVVVNKANTVEVKFPTAGEYTVLASEYKTGLATVAANADYSRTPAEILATLKANPGQVRCLNNTVSVAAATAQYTITLGGDASADAVSISADNGFDVKTIKVTVKDANEQPAIGVKVALDTNSYAVELSDKELTTNVKGEAEFKVAAGVAGTYEVYVSNAYAQTKTLTVNSGVVTVAGIEVAVAPTAPVALKTESPYTNAEAIGFKLTDAAGTVITDQNDPADMLAAVKVTVVDEPATSTVGDQENLTLGWDAQKQAWVIKNAAIKKAGDYTFKVALKNGKSATAEMSVAKFTKPVALKLVYKQDTVAYGESVAIKSVDFVDANGVTKDATDYVTFTANGVAVAAVDNVTADASGDTPAKVKGQITVKNDDDYIGSTITVMAVSSTYDLVATAELKVVDKAATVVFATTDAKVAVNNTLVAKVVDAQGNKVAMNADVANVKHYVLEKPANAKVAIVENAVNAGTTQIGFTPSAAGEYKIQTVITYTEGSASKYISGINTVKVGVNEGAFEDTVVVSIGSDKMIVNNETIALDVPAFIENNRTMLQFNVLYAFGIDVQWDGVDTITAEGNGSKVVMKLGSKVAVVNGEEVALDVAPYAVNGRTVVPVGFLTGTFGLTPNFGYGEAGLDFIIFTK